MAFNLGFFNNPQHRVFHYEPLYYDARKEALDEKIRSAKEEQENDKGKDREYKPGRNIRGKIQHNLYYNKKNSGSTLITRIVVIITLLGIAAVLWYFAEGLGTFFQ